MMKSITRRCLMLMLASGCCVGAALAADELPRRKPGLWEIDNRVEGLPAAGTIRQCIDRDTDNLMLQQARDAKSACGTMDIRSTGGKVTVHSVCQVEASTVTTDAQFEGAFDTSYRGTIHSRFQPPLRGIGETTVTQQARWLGPCAAGQKPGEVSVPALNLPGGVKLDELMKNPRLQELLRRGLQ